MAPVIQALGFVGAVIVAAGYLPQITHLAKEHCSEGISLSAWSLWLISSLLFFSHALAINDAVFLALQAVNLIAIATVISLTRRFRGMVCDFHANGVPVPRTT